MVKAGMKILIITTILTGVFSTPVLAQVMTSTNFKMQQDSINFGGGYSNSDSFQEEDSMGEIATGYSSSTNFILHAGYQQMKSSFIALAVPTGTLSMSPSISGLYGGTASGTTDINVMTTNESGYVLQINASTTPAMQRIGGSNFFNNYTPLTGDPDFSWEIAPTTSEFGFTPEGVDISDKYRDNGSSCNIIQGTDTLEKCWGLLSQTLETVAQSDSSNDPQGITTTIRFRAQNGNQHVQPSGIYRAQIIITTFTN